LGRPRPKRGRVISWENALLTQCVPRAQPSVAPVRDVARRSRRNEPELRSSATEDAPRTDATLRAQPRNEPVERNSADSLECPNFDVEGAAGLI